MPIPKSLLLSVSLCCAITSSAQDVHFPPFEASPLFLNPALTGMFEGKVRAAGIYYTQWGSVTVPYISFGTSFDMPVLIRKNGYLAVGAQLLNSKAGDGNLRNAFSSASIAYHKKLNNKSEFAVGLQGGYSQRDIDLSKLFFVDEFNGGTFVAGTSSTVLLGMGNFVQEFYCGGGAVFSQSVTGKVNYTVGLSVNSISQPNEAILTKKDRQGAIYTAIAGINLLPTERFTFHPAALLQTDESAINIVAGNEFRYNTLKSLFVFTGLYYRTGETINITGGINIKSFRIGLAYDYNISSLNPASNGKGGFMLNLKYIARDFKSPDKKRFVPCNRF